MFCTNCGAQAFEADQFCPSCGTPLKHNTSHSAGQQPPYSAQSDAYANPQPQYQPQPQHQSKPGNPFAPEEPSGKGKKRGRRSVGVIAALLVMVVIAMLLFAGARGYMGDEMGSMLNSCAACPGQGFLPGSEPGSDFEQTEPSEETATTTASTTTTTATTTTTTTTQKPTTTTTVDAKKLEAEEIRELLVSRKWQTELEGYKATVAFKSNGTATITVKVLFITKTIDAKYSIDDKCHAVIQTEYEGQALGISGYISKVSSTKLVVERDMNMGKVTLTAA